MSKLETASDAWVIAEEQANTWSEDKPWSEAYLDHEKVLFHTTVYVHPSSTVGKGSVIFPFAYIGPNVAIGEDCVIGPNSCIGQPGFGYEQDKIGHYRYRRHTFGVELGEDVHIGAGACIDQGRHRMTKIGAHTRIDNLVHVGHNVEIGESVIIVANSMIGGSCELGDFSYISAATLSDHVKVGENAHVGLGAVVLKDVPANKVVVGNPAKVLRDRDCSS